jgi:tetratricopeptide (TPR) repeat protein
VHSGSDRSPAAQQRKLARDLHILELELAERPEHPFTLFNLGMTYVHASRFAEAANFLKRGIARSNPDESHLRKAYALLVQAETHLGQRETALETCRRGRALFPRDAELLFREGVVLQELRRFDEARRAYAEVLGSWEERHFASVDRGLTGFKAHHNLAVMAAERGDLAEAEREWREVVTAAPGYRLGWRGLGETLTRQERYQDAEALAKTVQLHDAARTEGYLLESRVALALGNLPGARDALDRAAVENPNDREVLSSRAQFFFEHGTPEEAEAATLALIAHDPGDARSHHNLGTLLLRAGRFDDAARACRQSLRFRSDSAATYMNLAAALKGSGRLEEAVGAWEQVLRLVPGDPTARRELILAGRAGMLVGA